MVTKKPKLQPEEAEIITMQSVVDGKLVYVEGYSTLEPINKTSKLVRYGNTNVFFTKK